MLSYFGQPFQPPVDPTQLVGIGRRLDAVSQVTNHHHIALYVTFGVIDAVNGGGGVDWGTVNTPLVFNAQDRAMGAYRDVGRLEVKLQSVPLRPLLCQTEKVSRRIVRPVLLYPSRLIGAASDGRSTPLAAP